MAKQVNTEDNDKLKVATQTEVKNIMLDNPDYGWFALQTYSGKEAAAKRSVEDCLKAKGRDEDVGIILMPEKVFSELRKDKMRQVKKKLYPGYLFIYAKRKWNEDKDRNSLMMEQGVYSSIISAVNIHAFVGQEKDSLPKMIMKTDVDNILRNLQETGDVEQTLKFEVGAKVKINNGDFAGLFGNISDVDYEDAKLTVDVQMLGTTTPVQISFSDALAQREE